MKYACLIYDPAEGALRDGAEATQMYGEYAALMGEAGKHYDGGYELTPTSSATTLRLRNGKRLLTEGPYAETKEVLNGVMVFDCASLDEALEFASKIPSARNGSIEIRPIVERQA